MELHSCIMSIKGIVHYSEHYAVLKGLSGGEVVMKSLGSGNNTEGRQRTLTAGHLSQSPKEEGIGKGDRK